MTTTELQETPLQAAEWLADHARRFPGLWERERNEVLPDQMQIELDVHQKLMITPPHLHRYICSFYKLTANGQPLRAYEVVVSFTVSRHDGVHEYREGTWHPVPDELAPDEAAAFFNLNEYTYVEHDRAIWYGQRCMNVWEERTEQWLKDNVHKWRTKYTHLRWMCWRAIAAHVTVVLQQNGDYESACQGWSMHASTAKEGAMLARLFDDSCEGIDVPKNYLLAVAGYARAMTGILKPKTPGAYLRLGEAATRLFHECFKKGWTTDQIRKETQRLLAHGPRIVLQQELGLDGVPLHLGATVYVDERHQLRPIDSETGEPDAKPVNFRQVLEENNVDPGLYELKLEPVKAKQRRLA